MFESKSQFSPPFHVLDTKLDARRGTTILFYDIGGAYQLQWLDDLLFATVSTAIAGGFYASEYILSTIVCDATVRPLVPLSYSGMDCMQDDQHYHTLDNSTERLPSNSEGCLSAHIGGKN